ncbi:MAG: hypothetical protein Q8M98_02070 [Candidatus Cloacimonadaceae bacterium]|nr:hypothetical protein [Candidatus Cloacimonadaceae bacterium]
MKKLLLPLLLLVAFGMLAAVESAPSEVVGYVKYEIASGNSMLALPMTMSLSLAGEVGDLVGATTVSYWDNAEQAFVAAEYIDWMGEWDNNFPVQNGSVLMVNCGASTTFYSIGGLPATHPVYQIVSGNSMLMIPLNRSDLNLAGLVGDLASATTVSYWSNTEQAFVAAEYIDWMGEWDNNFSTSIGDPLMVNSDQTGVFPGTRNRVVRSNQK